MNLPTIQSNFKDLVASAAAPAPVKNKVAYIKFDFKTGDFLYGKEQEDVTGEEVLIFTPQLQYGYKWWDGSRFHDHFKPMLAGGADYPNQDGDWEEAASVAFAFDDGTMAEISSSAHYLRQAANTLYAKIFDQIGKAPEYIFPRVKLTSQSYESQFGGTNYSVVFEVIEWCDQNGDPMPEEKPALEEAKPVTRRRRS